MKKILFFISFLLLIVPLVVSAEELFYCNCLGSGEKIGGNDCVVFTSSTVAKENCIKCNLTSVQPDIICADFAGNTKVDNAGPSIVVPDKTVKLNNPLESGGTDINAIIGNIIKTAMGVMGALVLLMIVWGGFTWLTAAGNPEKVKSGSNTIMWAVLGSVVVLGSYFLLTTVLKALAG